MIDGATDWSLPIAIIRVGGPGYLSLSVGAAVWPGESVGISAGEKVTGQVRKSVVARAPPPGSEPIFSLSGSQKSELRRLDFTLLTSSEGWGEEDRGSARKRSRPVFMFE
jgi:hypothetical protein